MRQVSKEVCQAFINRKPKRVKNTHSDGRNLFLHNNKIAWRASSGHVGFTLAGWNTPTTRERLNAIFTLLDCPIRVGQHKHRPYVYNTITRERTEISSVLPYYITDFIGEALVSACLRYEEARHAS